VVISKVIDYCDMDMEIYHIPPGNRGFGEGLLKRLAGRTEGPDYSGIMYLAPTTHMLRNWKHAFRKEAGECYIPPRIMDLRQVARNICTTSGSRQIIPGPLMPVIISASEQCGMGYANIVSHLIGELKSHYPSTGPDQIRESLAEAASELDIPDEVSGRITDALDVFERYEETLAEKGLMDEFDMLSTAAGAIKGTVADILILDGFYEITRAEEHLVRALVEHAEGTVITVPVSAADDDLSHCYTSGIRDFFNVRPVTLESSVPERVMHLYPSSSMEEEVEDIARRIKSGYITGRQRDLEDIFVVFPSLRTYRRMVERVFRRYGIPCSVTGSMSHAVERARLDLLSMLDAVSGDYPRIELSRFLTSPFFQNIPAALREGMPLICLESGIIKGRDSWLQAFRARGLNKEGAWVFKVLGPLESIRKKGGYREFAGAVLDIIRTLGFKAPEGGDFAPEDLLKDLSQLDGIIGNKADLSGFIDTIRMFMRHGGDEDRPGVRVAELFDMRGLEPGMLYMGGLRDGDIPSPPRMDLLLPDSLRKRLGLVDMQRHMRLQKLIFTRLTAVSGGLGLSYPTMDGDSYFLPSVFVSGAEVKSDTPSGLFSPEEEMLRKGNTPLSEHIRQIRDIKRYKEDSAISVTDIDSYRSCPRRFLIERGLKLRPPEIKEYEIDALTTGTLAHMVMERVAPEAAEDLDRFRKLVSEALDEVLLDQPLNAYFKNLFREAFMGIAADIFALEEDIRAKGYSFASAEEKIECEPIEGVRLKGKVDRLDKGPDGQGVEVLDYKTGPTDLTGSKILKLGATLQLPIYAAMLRKNGMRPERVGIYSLRDLKIKWLPGRKDQKDGRSIDDYIESSLKYLGETAAGIRSGDFTARPIEEHRCRMCPERPYCPFIQRGREEEGEEA
jgi:ATP-dependent helicase/DNAse subunit B